MKTLKGIGIYTLVILGILLVIAGLLVGCMFLMPGFKMFGWTLLAKNHEVSNYTGPSELSASTYTVNIDASIYNVTITLGDGKSVYVTQSDEMYGFYRPAEYTEDDFKTSITQEDDEKIINIDSPSFSSSISARKSALIVNLPKDAKEYNLNVTTSTGNIAIRGTDKNAFPLKELEINTESGNVSFDKLRSIMYYNVSFDSRDMNYDGIVDSKDDRNGDGVIDAKDDDDYLHAERNDDGSLVADAEIDSDRNKEKDKNGDGKSDNKDKEGAFEIVSEIPAGANKNFYFRVIPLEKVKINSGKGDVDFRFTSSNFNAANEIFVTKSFGAVNAFTNLNQFKAILDNESGYADVILNTRKGDVNFGQLYCKGFQLNGDDVLLRATSIKTCDEFKFNSPSGLFEIGNLYSELSTITTNNIGIKLGKITGELSITTTYGNIEIDETEKNTSLNTVHGNIKVGNAKGSISAISDYGDIDVRYYGQAYFKNNHGSIKVEFVNSNKGNAGIERDKEYNGTCEIITGKGTVTAKNLTYETTITTNGGRVTAQFSEMYESSNKEENNISLVVHHKVIVNSGSAEIQIPSLKAFMFKGEGNITGAVGSTVMAATANNEYEVKVGETANDLLAHLEVNAKGGRVNFSTYWAD